MKKVGLIGIGAAKCGSSWVSYLLEQHPEVEMSSRKEVAYFNPKNFDGAENTTHQFDLNYYHKFWSSEELLKAEFSPQYIADEEAIKKIKAYNPKVKLLAVFRSPMKRALSHYLYDVGFNQLIPKDLNFDEALKEYPYLLELGLFGAQMEQVLKHFDKAQVKVVILEHAIESPRTFAQELYEFIGLDPNFCPSTEAVNENKAIQDNWKSRLAQLPSRIKQKLEKDVPVFEKILTPLKSTKWYIHLVQRKTKVLESQSVAQEKVQLSNEQLNSLYAYYETDIQKLEQLVGVDLKCWKPYTN